MIRWLIVALVLSAALPSAVALAGDPEPELYRLEVTPTELNAIGAALAAQPWGQVNGIIVKLQNQRTAQQAALNKPSQPKAADKK